MVTHGWEQFLLAGTALVGFLICIVKYVSNIKKNPASNILNILIAETKKTERDQISRTMQASLARNSLINYK